MYPGTIINIIDQSQFTDPTTAVTVDHSPLYLAVSSFDRGPEDLRVVNTSSEFHSLYGTDMNFKKNGQPAIQAANEIDGGARLFIKRLVPDDALLGNLILAVTATATTKAKKAADGEDGVSLTYLKTGTDSASDTTKYVVEGTPAINLKWEASSITNCKTIDDVIKSITPSDITATSEGDDEVTVTKTGKFYMLVVTDNGRSSVVKSIKIAADASLSRNLSDMLYDYKVYIDGTSIDSGVASLNKDAIYNDTRYQFSEFTSPQVKFAMINGEYERYIAFLASATGLTEEELKAMDVIYGKDNRNRSIEGLTVDPESIALDATFGIEIPNGSYGEFDTQAFGSETWARKAVAVFNGEEDDKIWDIDSYKIAACFDANYPEKVKDSIIELANFRKDFMFFRDFGLDMFSYTDIINYSNRINKDYNTMFMANYLTTYMIYDPTTHERERVTMMYDMSRAAIGIFSSGAAAPMAGIVNNMILTNAIEGTLNFVPKVVGAKYNYDTGMAEGSEVNQKQLLDDARVNYAIFMDGQCVVQTLYTAKSGMMSQLSFVNNVLAIQEVARAVRSSCPKWRYTFVTGSDFQVYAKDVQNILQQYNTNFEELNFEYTQDTLESMHKIFHASISFRFNNWAQTEIFDLYALPNQSTRANANS